MNKEILMVVDAVSNEKGVDKEIIFEALEAALAAATRKKHGEEWDVRVAINRKSGDYDTFRRWKVFADDSTELETPDRELRLEDALDIDKDAEPGEFVEEPWYAPIQGAHPLSTRLLGKRACEVRLADAGHPGDQHVLLVGDPPPGRELLQDLIAPELQTITASRSRAQGSS